MDSPDNSCYQEGCSVCQVCTTHYLSDTDQHLQLTHLPFDHELCPDCSLLLLFRNREDPDYTSHIQELKGKTGLVELIETIHNSDHRNVGSQSVHCSEHPGQDVTGFCKTCQKTVCDICSHAVTRATTVNNVNTTNEISQHNGSTTSVDSDNLRHQELESNNGTDLDDDHQSQHTTDADDENETSSEKSFNTTKSAPSGTKLNHFPATEESGTMVNHSDHDICDIYQAGEIMADKLRKDIVCVKQAVSDKQMHVEDVLAEKEMLASAKKTALQKADEIFAKMMEVIKKKHQEVTTTIQEKFQEKSKHLDQHIDSCESQILCMDSTVQVYNTALRDLDVPNLVTMATTHCKTLENKVQEYNNTHTDSGKNYIEFDSGPCVEYVSSAQEYIQVRHDEKQLPAVVQVETVPATAGFTSTAEITLSSSSKVALSGYPVEVEIRDKYNEVIKCAVQDNEDGTYTAHFKPQVSGMHYGSVNPIDNKTTVRGSQFEFDVQSNDPVLWFGGKGKEPGLFNFPRTLTVDPTGDVYVVDELCRVQIFNELGTFKSHFKLDGDLKDYNAVGVAVCSSDDTLICPLMKKDQHLGGCVNTIAKLTKTGEQVSMATQPFQCGMHLAINSKDQIIVADLFGKCLYILSDTSGEQIQTVSGRGLKNFRGPNCVCVMDDDSIVVSDTSNNCIHVFDEVGNYLFNFGQKGHRKGEFRGPQGVAADQCGHILVADQYNNRVQVFDRNGQFVLCIESTGSPLHWPRGIAVTNDGHMYVADSDHHIVKKFKYLE
ncbi:E3 ubiquitin-protein ligase TRIM71 [Lingula anatina]|uniref:E3 ubiquitin-protein ligase TRIM71 n=1 Tax=Lingula anatina TaxID=7574 RepID=A0A1S3HFU8_LINAN|nr:E3 ubiquitin-protein ligase TRIM71 [Lingula anatina]|eukprot:XP_013384356.1 E3 ubiquitin-protein ligase TRIM71 [Lingula anatina]